MIEKSVINLLCLFDLFIFKIFIYFALFIICFYLNIQQRILEQAKQLIL